MTLIIANGLGFLCIAAMFHIAQQQGIFSSADTADGLVTAYFQNAMIAWLIGAIISIGYLFSKAPLKYILLATPIFGVLVYSLKFAFFNSAGV